MKRRTISLALFHDALYQVLDNKVFRILMILTVALVAIPWVIGFREDEVVLLWGWRTYFYEDLLSSMGWLMGTGSGTDQERVISQIQNLVVGNLAGIFGVFFCLSATSFFVPRLLEKGAADPLFSKPVSRFSLLFSRYVAGLIFIAGLAIFLIGGIHLGLLANSQYSDPTFLWTIPILVYKFGLLFSFTVMVGVWTRSATAALLLSFVFLAFTGGIHIAWKNMQFFEEMEAFEKAREFTEIAGDPQLEEIREDVDLFGRIVLGSVSTLHHALPKTSDADPLAALLRKQLEAPQYQEEIAFELNSNFVVGGLRPDGILELRIGGETRFAAPQDDGIYETRLYGQTIEVVWPEGGPPLVTQDSQPIALLDPDEVDAKFSDPFTWYESKFDWDSPWRFNAWYSLGSSLAFVVAMLLLAWVRLRRINF